MKNKTGKIFIMFWTILFLISLAYVFVHAAGVVDSGHNILKQDNKGDFMLEALEGKAGVCSFCHLPHSSTGHMDVGIASGAIDSTKWGAVGHVCKKCHGKEVPVGEAPTLSLGIFTPPGDYTKVQQQHPLLYNTTDPFGTTGTRQWMSGWPGAGRDHKGFNEIRMAIECTSCHNVHAVTPGTDFDINRATYNGTGASGEFLRIKPFDSTKPLGDTTVYDPITGKGAKQIFCEYCHTRRSQMGWATYNFNVYDGDSTATHPVGVPQYGVQTDNDSTIRRVYDRGRGWDSSIVVEPGFTVGITPHTEDSTAAHMGGGDHKMGYETTNPELGIVICQTCHKPHFGKDPGQSHDGVYRLRLDGEQPASQDVENVLWEDDSTIPDLLVFDNRGKFETSAPLGGAQKGFNVLCEKCHSYAPFLSVSAKDPVTGDREFHKGHPLRHHKYESGNYNHDSNWESVAMYSGGSCFDDDDKYESPSITIPANWPTGGVKPGDHKLVCLTCHDVHGARPRTSLLRKIPICKECHKGPLRKLGITHPVNVSLKTPDNGCTWPDQAALTLFTPQMFDTTENKVKVIRASVPVYPILGYKVTDSYDVLRGYMVNNPDIVKIQCETCHNWADGNIHYDVSRRRDPQMEVDPSSRTRYLKNDVDIKGSVVLHKTDEDPNANSELCVSCHTMDNFRYQPDLSNVSYGFMNHSTLGAKFIGANPSPWIMEYPSAYTGTNLVPKDAEDVMETTRLSRLGTHATGFRVAIEDDAEGIGHMPRADWVYYAKWGGDTTFSAPNLDPLFSGTGNDLPCNRMLSGKRSKWGELFDTFTDKEGRKPYAAIICQSCHTPHNAAAGLVEYNTGAGSKEASPHTALLVATQAESFMCRVCHLRGGGFVHPLNRPSYPGPDPIATKYISGRDVPLASYMDSLDYSGGQRLKGMRKSDVPHVLLLTLDQETTRAKDENIPKSQAIYLRDTTNKVDTTQNRDPGGSKWAVTINNGPKPPANYPRKGGSLSNWPGSSNRKAGWPGTDVGIDTTASGSWSDRSMLVCDSCHAPHAAGTPGGTYCLEANDSSVPGKKVGELIGDTNDPGMGAAQPSDMNDNPTCLLCHPQ
ncbi:MAG: hypothetical protein HY934_08395 [Candidatus Firestonebacteria bacterium]|nr:hypothetical protein [Candidatus Firestonebacteria bacterium]